MLQIEILNYESDNACSQKQPWDQFNYQGQLRKLLFWIKET